MLKPERRIFFLLLCSGILRECCSGLNDGIFSTEDIDTSECRGSIIFRDKDHQEIVTFYATNNSTGKLKPVKVELKGCGCFTLYRRKNFRMGNQKILTGGSTEVTLMSVGSLKRRENCEENRLYSDVTYATPATAQKVIATARATLNTSTDKSATTHKTTKEEISQSTDEIDSHAKTVGVMSKTALLSNADSEKVTEQDIMISETISETSEIVENAENMQQNIPLIHSSHEECNETIRGILEEQDSDTATENKENDMKTDVSDEINDALDIDLTPDSSLDEEEVNETIITSEDAEVVTLTKEPSEKEIVETESSTSTDIKEKVIETYVSEEIPAEYDTIPSANQDKLVKQLSEIEEEESILSVVTSRTVVITASETKLIVKKENSSMSSITEADEVTKAIDVNMYDIEDIDEEKTIFVTEDTESNNTDYVMEKYDYEEKYTKEEIAIKEDQMENVEEIVSFSTLESATNLKQTRQNSQIPVPLPYSSPLRTAAENKSTPLHQFASLLVKFFMILIYVFLY